MSVVPFLPVFYDVSHTMDCWPTVVTMVWKGRDHPVSFLNFQFVPSSLERSGAQHRNGTSSGMRHSQLPTSPAQCHFGLPPSVSVGEVKKGLQSNVSCQEEAEAGTEEATRSVKSKTKTTCKMERMERQRNSKMRSSIVEMCKMAKGNSSEACRMFDEEDTLGKGMNVSKKIGTAQNEKRVRPHRQFVHQRS